MSVDQFLKTFSWAATYPTKLGTDMIGSCPEVKMLQAHSTVSGTRFVVKFELDPHHTYEVLVSPIFPKK